MTAKEYLDQVKALDGDINDKLKDYSNLQTRCTALGGTGYSKERVQMSPEGEARYAKLLDDMVDLQNEINSEIDKYIDMRSNALKMLRSIFPGDTVRIVWLRHNKNCLWTDITQQTGINCRTAQRRYDKAMKILKNTIYSV